VLAELRIALRSGHAVLSAPPGSGKTTRVPLALLDEPWLDGQRILMLEPRRPAVRMSAARMAYLRGEAVGGTVGYQVRFERRIGTLTRIQVLTEGILTRRIQSDPGLDGVGLPIFDEFHERNLQADLGLALALDAAVALRPDLRILVMSATLDTEAVSMLLGGARVVQGKGRTYPVDMIYAQRRCSDPVDTTVAGVKTALSEQTGDVLAFLPGAGEIHRARDRLESALSGKVEVLPLHGNLPTTEQDRALRPNKGDITRVVLATDIAETSVTIEGVTTVVDSGVTRKPRFDPGTGLTRLVTEPVSRASADQRAGRAGRTGPGTCYRLWTHAQEVGRLEHRPAEILQADLAPLVLELALWGVRAPTKLAWLDPPPAPAWSRAVALLQQLDALDDNGAITALGREMAELPVHPRLARMLAAKGGGGRLAADIAALLSDRDPLLGTAGTPRPADLGLRLLALEVFRESRQVQGMERRRLAAADRVSRQLLRNRVKADDVSSLEPGGLLALAYPDRVAKRRSGSDGRYLLAAGLGAILPADDPLAAHELLVIADLDVRRREGRIRLALPVSEFSLREVLADRLQTQESVHWDEQRQAVAARTEERYGALSISSRPQPIADPALAAQLLIEQVGKRFEQALTWSPEARQLQARVALLRRLEPQGGWPDLSDERLREQENLSLWLGPWLDGKQSLAGMKDLNVSEILQSLLDWEHRKRLDAQAPPTLVTPAGNRRRLDYTAGPDPVLAVSLQEMLGVASSPTVCSGRVPVTLHLLSPARRPLQVTRDLAGFWIGSYAEVRKEMRGRYPKHHWPEDPANEQPMSRSVKHPRRR
jgi:ATP-dependent helicase HrpB